MASPSPVRPDAAADRGTPPSASAPRLINLKDVCRRTGLGRTTIAKLLAAGDFPAKVYVSPGIVRWDVEAVDRWIVARIAASAAGRRAR